MTQTAEIKDFYDKRAKQRLRWNRRNWFYHAYLRKHFAFIIPAGSRVLEIGCGSGDLLASLKPSYGIGVDLSGKLIEEANQRYPHLTFIKGDGALSLPTEKFDYIVLSDLLHLAHDAQVILHNLQYNCIRHTRIVISNYHFIWEPVLRISEFLNLKMKSPTPNWFTHFDIFNLLEIEGFQVVKHERKLLLPKYIPLLHTFFNSFLVNLPFINLFGLVNFVVARPHCQNAEEYTVSVVIPARNEKGNIENAIKRIPPFGISQQLVFIEGNSSDGTYEEMQRIKNDYPDRDIMVMRQTGKGKGNAVREGFDSCTGDVLMILDADLTTPPEDLPKFYNALKNHRGEFINGCRLVYPMEKQAMRFLNLLGNKFFSWFFSYLLGQRLKDTLCGTKVLFRQDYQKIKENRSYFGDFDPFGDFDLLFGAAKLNMKIVEIYVRYKDREYGTTQISRFRHGWLLLKMSFYAATKIKFR